MLNYLISLVVSFFGVAGWLYYRRSVERHNAEATLCESESRFRHTFKYAPVGVVNISLDGHLLEVNQSYCEMMGYSREELLTMTISQLTHPDHHEADKDLLMQALNGKIPGFKLEKQCIRKDGSLVWGYLSITVFRRFDDTPVYFIAIIENIEQRKQFEAMQRKTKASLRAILDNLPYMVWLKDCNGRYLEINEAYVRYARLTEKREVIGKTDFDLWPKEFAESYVADDAEVIATRQKKNIEERALDGDRLHWVETFKSPVVDESGDVLGTTGFFRDITERKLKEEARLNESEERFRILFDSMGDAIFVHHFSDDAEMSCFDEVNEVACAWLGYTKKLLLQLTPMNVFSFKTSGDISVHFRELEWCESVTFEHELTTNDGDFIPVEIRATNFLFGGQNAIISVARNIAERKRAEGQLRALSTHLMTVREEEQARISREIHDELGGALVAIKIDAYWLQQNLIAGNNLESLQTRIESMCKQIDEAAHVARRVVSDLRPSILDDLGLRAAIEWQAEQFQKRTGIECGVWGDNEHECVENLDKRIAINLFRIVQESLSNVSKHSRASKVKIELSYSQKNLVLSVSDNGCGIDEKMQHASNCFGLKGMFERVQSLGGGLKFEHSEGGGLTIRMDVPLSSEVNIGGEICR